MLKGKEKSDAADYSFLHLLWTFPSTERTPVNEGEEKNGCRTGISREHNTSLCISVYISGDCRTVCCLMKRNKKQQIVQILIKFKIRSLNKQIFYLPFLLPFLLMHTSFHFDFLFFRFFSSKFETKVT